MTDPREADHAPNTPTPERLANPTRLEWAAWAAVLLSLAAHGLMRQRCNDIGSHLATARLAEQVGQWPVVNTFSYPHADFPLYCQYVVFEWIAYGAHQLAGWEGLSLLRALGWGAVFLLFVRWGGGLRRAAVLHLAWMIALMALQRRMVLRPELMSMLLLGLTLLACDAYLRGRRWAVATLPLIHLTWVNAHQLFPISLGVQGLLLLQVWLARSPRFRLAPDDPAPPLYPAVVAVACSVGATFLTPLGSDIWQVPLWTADTLQHHRHHVREFAYLWERPLELRLALACGALTVLGLWLARTRWQPFELGLWLGTLVLVLSTMRGLVFFSLVSVAVFARSLARWAPPQALLAQLRPRVRDAARSALAVLTLLLAANVVYHRWIAPPMVLGGTHPGLGRTSGDWPEAAIARLREDPPPGRMMNVPWSAASALIWFAPELPTFVDARFETFPRQFLVDAIESMHDDAVLERLLEEHTPSWIYAEHCRDSVRTRLAHLVVSGRWVPTYADAQVAVLVRSGPDTAAYLTRRRLDRFADDPADLVATHPGLRAQQRACYGTLLHALGRHAEGARQLERAREEAGSDAVAVQRIREIAGARLSTRGL